MILLKIHNINVSYGEMQVLHNVSISIEKGSWVSLIGPNGAGKTTLLNTIIGFLKPSSGTITFNGERIDTLKVHERVRKGLSLVPEDRKLFPRLTVLENLEMGAYMLSKEEKEKRLEEVFELFPRLKERKKQLANTLSGGERQMLCIGRALMSRPQLLMLDEPSLGLAPNLVDTLFETLRVLKEKEDITILLVEQKVKHAIQLSDKIYLMEKGKLTEVAETGRKVDEEYLRKKYLIL
mgnify:CR=1 FL=1